MGNLYNLQNDMNFVNESHLFTQGKTIATTYTTTAREPSIYASYEKKLCETTHRNIDHKSWSKRCPTLVG